MALLTVVSCKAWCLSIYDTNQESWFQTAASSKGIYFGLGKEMKKGKGERKNTWERLKNDL